jgi:hypothetical protein
MPRQKLLHLGGDSQYERRDPTIESEDLIVVDDTHSINREIERQSLQRVGGDYLRYPTEPSIGEVLPCSVYFH